MINSSAGARAALCCAIAGLWAAGCGSDDAGPGGPPPSVISPVGGGGGIAGTTTPPMNMGTAGLGNAGAAGVTTAGGGATVSQAGASGMAGATAGVSGGAAGMMMPAGMGGMGMAGMTPAGMGGGGIPDPTGGMEPKLPMITEMCPTLATGNVTVLGQQVQLWVGNKQEGKKGPVFFYWHGTGGRSTEAVGGLGPALQEIMGAGGIVASFTTTTTMGTNTGNNVWYTGDFRMADIILVCATQQLNIETKRIYTGGCSAGGLQAGAMVYGRATYLAAAMPNSGGGRGTLETGMGGYVPATITTHGAMGTDVVVIDFAQTSNTLCRDIAAKGGFAVDCDHGGRHCGSSAAVKAAQWEFLKAHPYGTKPSPYAGGLPATFPSFCKIIM